MLALALVPETISECTAKKLGSQLQAVRCQCHVHKMAIKWHENVHHGAPFTH
jgi:hypothetical protein